MEQTEQELLQILDQNVNYLKEMRQQEKNLRTQEQVLGPVLQVSGDGSLEKNMRSILPPSLMPCNVGPLKRVTWPFFNAVNFDFGTGPVFNTALRQVQSFQVSQEAALLMMGIARSSSNQSRSGANGPWQLTIRDRQSSRQFNDSPIPFQHFGADGEWSVLPVPMLFMPNAFVEFTMSTWQTNGTVGDGNESKHQIMVFGQRVRVESVAAVLSTIFG